MFEKLIAIYPELNIFDFCPNGGTIIIQNDLDGKGDYIAKWEHPTFTQPTQAELEAIGK